MTKSDDVAPDISPVCCDCHWYVKVGDGAPVQVPSEEEIVTLTTAAPKIVGEAVFTGATAPGVIVLLEPLAALVPAELVAVTVKLYEVREVKPLTVIGELAEVPVIPPGLEVAVNPVIEAPPLSLAVNATVAVVDEVAVAVPIVGAKGTFATTAAVALLEAALDPAELDAVTIQRIDALT
jgi:hypothetical protein